MTIEEMQPKKRGRPPKDPRTAEEVRAEKEADGTFVNPLRETYPGPVAEPPPLTQEEVEEMAAKAAEIFADDMVAPEDWNALLRDSIDAAEQQMERIGRGRIMRDERTLIDKIVAVMSKIDAVEKKGTNQAMGYSYQRAVDVTATVRQHFIEEGLVFTSSVERTQTTVLGDGGGKTPNIMFQIDMLFRITDGREVIEFGGSGAGIDRGDKGIYKAITGALKYGLRTLLLIPDEKMDPEVEREDERPQAPINITPSSVQGVAQGGRQSQATSAQMTAIKNSANALGLDPGTFRALIVSVLGEGPDEDLNAAEILGWVSDLSFEDAGKITRALVEATTTNGGA